jgi:hypothetical protein
MEMIGMGILFMIGVYLAPFIFGIGMMIVIGFLNLFTDK